MKNLLFIGLGLLVASFSAGQLSGDIVVTENFDYPDGNLVGNGGWASHNAAGSSPVQVLSSAASLAHGSGSREDVNISFAAVNSGLIEYNFDMTVTDDAPIAGTNFQYFAHFGVGGGSSLTSFVGRLDVVEANGSGDYSLGIATFSGTADDTLAQDFNFGDVVNVTVSYDIDNDIASLTVGSETIVGADGTASGLNIGAFGLRQSNSTSDESITVDNLVVTTSAAIPEPTSAILVGFGAVAMAFRRRR